jgi:hypothetical protein
MKYLVKFNEGFDILKKYPKKPGESTSSYRSRITGIKRREQEAWKTVDNPSQQTKETNPQIKDTKSKVLDLIPELKIGEKQFDKEIETIVNSYAENKERADFIFDDFMKELNIRKSELYNSDGSPKDSEEILKLLDERGNEIQNPDRLQELSKKLMSIIGPVKEEVYTPIIGLSLGIIGTLATLAWIRGRTRLTLYQTASPKPTKWYQKGYYWLKSKGIDLSFGLDPNREHPLIVSDRPYGRTYGINSNDPNDRVRTVLDPSYGPEKGGQPLVTGSGTKYGYRTSVG